MTATNRFTPKLGQDPAYMKAEDNSIPFVMTKNDRDTATLARVAIIAIQRQFGRNVDGLEVGEVSPTELSPEERRSFAL